MRIEHIEVQSFRSIGRCKIDFNKMGTEASDIWLFVGDPSSGKSSVLKAIELVIGEKSGKPVKKHNLHDYNENPDWKGVNQQLKVRIRCNDEESKGIQRKLMLDQEQPYKAELKEVDTDRNGMSKHYARFLFIESREKNYEKHLLYNIAQDDEFTVIGLLRKQLQRNFKLHGINELKKQMMNALRNVPGILDLYIDDHLHIYINDGSYTLITEKSPGLQKLVLLSLIEWLAWQERSVLKNYIIGIDEPEAHLPPQMIKHAARRLKQLSRRNQILAASCSPYFINEAGIAHVIRVVNEYQNSCFYGLPVAACSRHDAKYDYSSGNLIRVSERVGSLISIGAIKQLIAKPIFASESMANALLSSFVLIVEGEASHLYLPKYFTMWASSAVDSMNTPHYMDELDVCILTMSGKNSLLEFVIIFCLFHIPFHTIIDNESDGRNDKYMRVNHFIGHIHSVIADGADTGDMPQFSGFDDMEQYIQAHYAHIRYDQQFSNEWITIYRQLFQNRKYAVNDMLEHLDMETGLSAVQKELVLRMKPRWSRKFEVEDVSLNMMCLSSNPSAKFDASLFLSYWLASMTNSNQTPVLLFIGRYAHCYAMLEEIHRQAGSDGAWSRIDLALEVIQGLDEKHQQINDRVIAKCGLGHVFEVIKRFHLERKIKSRHPFIS